MSYLVDQLNEIVSQRDKRIEYLENIICPNGHDFQLINNGIMHKEIDFSKNTNADIEHYRCSRCNKYKKVAIHKVEEYYY